MGCGCMSASVALSGEPTVGVVGCSSAVDRLQRG
jgi:hypothetical protein